MKALPDFVTCGHCGETWPLTTRPYPLANGICHDCRRILKKPNYMLAAETQRLKAEIATAVSYITALGCGGYHDQCDPCEFVRRNASSGQPCAWCHGEGALRDEDGKLGEDCPRCKGASQLASNELAKSEHPPTNAR